MINFDEAVLHYDSPWGQILEDINNYGKGRFNSFSIDIEKLKAFMIRQRLQDHQPPELHATEQQMNVLEILLSLVDLDKPDSLPFLALNHFLHTFEFKVPDVFISDDSLSLVHLFPQIDGSQKMRANLFLESAEFVWQGIETLLNNLAVIPFPIQSLSIYVKGGQMGAKNVELKLANPPELAHTVLDTVMPERNGLIQVYGLDDSASVLAPVIPFPNVATITSPAVLNALPFASI